MSAPPVSVESRSEALRRVLTTAATRTWEFSLWEDQPDGEPRIRDVDAAEHLGYAEPRMIRKLIKRIWPENVGICVRSTVSRTQMPTGGISEKTVREYWLTEAQLLKVVARSETAIAEGILDEMIAVYMAVRRHLATSVPVEAHARKLPGRKALPVPEVTSHLTAAQAATLRAAAKKAGLSVEDLIDGAVTNWIDDLAHQLQYPSLIERRKGRFDRIRTVFVPLTEGLQESVESKANEMCGNTHADSRKLAAYALLEMGAFAQRAHTFAAMTFTKR